MRYILRGQKGIEQGDFTKFYVFIVAPQKYLSKNSEANKTEVSAKQNIITWKI